MEIDIYQLDTFTDRVFCGNPAAVCVLNAWLTDDILQAIATENNLSETAFIVPRDGGYHIRWFTPKCEISLCGHATLASGYVVLNLREPKRAGVVFQSASGPLTVIKKEDYFEMDLPVLILESCEVPKQLITGLNATPIETYRSKDYLAIFESEKQIRNVVPDFNVLSQLDLQGIIITAKGDHVDFVSRFFAPAKGINEDPVTGSAHCQLVPFWSERLGKRHLHAKQLSSRMGEIYCELKGARVLLKGKVVFYMQGKIKIG